MRLLFYLGHPAHYHNISKAVDALSIRGHSILFVAREKDVLLDLIKSTRYPKIVLSRSEQISRIFAVISREWKLFLTALRYQPEIFIGTDIVFTHVAKLMRRHSILLNEDDAGQVPLLAHYGFRYASNVLAPTSCNMTPYHQNNIQYDGYHELAYLHPNHFEPKRNVLKNFSARSHRYFLLRFAKLEAHHDKGRTGITTEIARSLISKLETHGQIYITAERELEPEFETYRLPLAPRQIHHALYFAHLYIGDSQTMAAEAAVLGTPSIRFNDFVGKLGYLEELEHKYGLTIGIKTSEPQRLYNTVEKLLNTPNLKSVWQERRQNMLADKIDVTAFMVWFIENYPESAAIMQKDPSYQLKFKQASPCKPVFSESLAE